MPLGESQSGVASVMVSKEGGNSDSGRDRPTGGPRGSGPPWPKEKKEIGPPAQRKRRIFFIVYIFLFIFRVWPPLSKNLNPYNFN